MRLKRDLDFTKFNALALCIILIFCIPQTVYAASYTEGQSLVAEDQVKASKGSGFPGLEISMKVLR